MNSVSPHLCFSSCLQVPVLTSLNNGLCNLQAKAAFSQQQRTKKGSGRACKEPYLAAVGRQYGKQEVPHGKPSRKLMEAPLRLRREAVGEVSEGSLSRDFLSKCLEQQQDGVWAEEFRSVLGDLVWVGDLQSSWYLIESEISCTPFEK